MSKRTGYVSPQPSLRTSLLVTLVAVVIPVTALLRLMAVEPEMNALVAIVTGLALIVVASLVSRFVWRKTLREHGIQVVDLFVWSWLRNRHVERKLYDKVAALGLLDNRGAPQLPRRRRLELLTQLTKALESSDPYTHGHSRRVARHAYRTALTMGLPPYKIEILKRAAQLHDVGKLDVPVAILQKASPLTDEERGLMEQHALYGAEMVSVLQDPELLEGVLHHHERWDGAGYPDGLEQDEIPLTSRIIAVADAFDAITSARPYRPAESRRRAVEIVRSERGAHFDPEVADAFVAAIPRISWIMASLGILAVPFKAFSRLFDWAKGMGRDYAPAAAAVGVAILVGGGAATLPPPVDRTPPSLAADAVPAPAPSGSDGGTEVKGTRFVNKNEVGVTSASAQADEPQVVPAPDPSPQAQNPPNKTTPEPKPTPSHQPSPTPDPSPTHPVAEPDVVGPPGNTAHCSDGRDPKPGKGKDCRRPGKNGNGKGFLKH